MKPFFLSALFISLCLAGCQSVRPPDPEPAPTPVATPLDDCRLLSPEEMGRMDGAQGPQQSRLKERAELCQTVGITLNEERYRAGEIEGLNEHYCTPLNAITIGEQGGTYSGACGHEMEERFLKFLHLGKRSRDIRMEIHQLDNKISHIASGEILEMMPFARMNKRQREEILGKQLILLTQQRDLLMKESEEIEERVERLGNEKVQMQRKKVLDRELALLNERRRNLLREENELANRMQSLQSSIGRIPTYQRSPNKDTSSATNKEVDINPPDYPITSQKYPMTRVGPNPGYHQMQIINDPSSPMPSETFKMDPTRSDFAATEYERSSRRDLHRQGQELSPPENNVTKDGTTLMINKDWYPH